MINSNTRAKTISPAVGKIVITLVLAALVGGVSLVPAFGDEYRDRGWHKGERFDRDDWRRDRRDWRDRRDRREYRPERSYAPVYAPPPVLYVPPPPSPGINLFFPFRIR